MTANPELVMAVNLRDYSDFLFRGAGRSNYIISATENSSGQKIAWRFKMAVRNGPISTERSCLIILNYNKFIGKVVDEKLLETPKLVWFHVEDVRQLSKIISLPQSEVVSSFYDLLNLKSDGSLENEQNVKSVPALQMGDVTEIRGIPKEARSAYVTLEMKPKQGFMNLDGHYCQNCCFQIQKALSGEFPDIYAYCPLDMFSGTAERTSKAISALLHHPHRNLRIFIEGALIHSNEDPMDFDLLEEHILKAIGVPISDFIKSISMALTGSDKFALEDESVLGKLLNAQKLDTLNTMKAYELFQGLDDCEKDKMVNSQLTPETMLDSLTELERFFVAATLKDVSVMLTMCEVTLPLESRDYDEIVLPSGKKIAFVAKIVDLDPKRPKNLVSAYKRIKEAQEFIENAESRPKTPCQFD